MSIIPFQTKFDKDFPVVIGNAEYNAECKLLKAMDLVIATSGMEETFIKYSLDVAYVNKALSTQSKDIKSNKVFSPASFYFWFLQHVSFWNL